MDNAVKAVLHLMRSGEGVSGEGKEFLRRWEDKWAGERQKWIERGLGVADLAGALE